MNKRKEYLTYIILILVGYSSLLFFNPNNSKKSLCIFRNITGLKCPGCGMYKGTYYLFQGKLFKAIESNIIILFISLFILTFLVLLVFDILFERNYLNSFENKILTNKIFILFTIILLLISLFYNNYIYKI
jgi:hypothetical protein